MAREHFFKRPFDFLLALAGLFITMPLWFIFAWAVWFRDGGPVFYAQERVGVNGNPFKNIKFRSMIKNAEFGMGPIQAREDDPRVTKVGRFLRRSAMDELPQLLNILYGEMSFVGPRPLRSAEIGVRKGGEDSVDPYLFRMRTIVRPGLTGVAQLFAPRDASRRQKLEYDLWYIENQGLALDIALILRSVWISITRGWDTGRRFKGGFAG